MRKHYFFRILSLMMVLILISSSSPLNNLTANAQTRSDPYYHIYGISLTRNGDGSLHITFNVTAKKTAAMVGVSFYRVQRRYNGNWSNVTDIIEGKLMTNTAVCVFGRDFDEAVSGVQYRVYARLYILTIDGTVAEIDYYSQSYTMP